MEKYILIKTKGGFFDIISLVGKGLSYCKKYNRTLLLNTFNSRTYRINFSDYFSFDEISDIKIIYDRFEIKKITNDKNKSIYPEFLNGVNLNFTAWRKENVDGYYFKNDELKRFIKFDLNKDYQEDILVYEDCNRGGSDETYGINQVFNLIQFKPNLLKDFNWKFKKINKPYLCIYVRNSDYKSDYKKLLNDNIKVIKKYKNIYLATDSIHVIKYFKTNKVNFKNFTKFPDLKIDWPYHQSDLDSDVLIKDSISDLLLISLADRIISNSNGKFIRMAKEFNLNKEIINKKCFS